MITGNENTKRDFASEMSALCISIREEVLEISKRYSMSPLDLLRETGCLLIEDAGRLSEGFEKWKQEQLNKETDNE